MRPSALVIALFALFQTACVTEDGRAPRPEESAKGPVEYAQDSIRYRIERLPTLRGRDLLQEIERLIAARELALEPIRSALPEADARTQANLLYVLGYIQSPESHAAVLPYLRSPDESVRYEAAAALMQLGDLSAAPALIAFLESEDRRLRYKAFECLKAATHQDFGFEFQADADARAAAVMRWKRWWAEQRAAMIYTQGR
jgi:hypothetical protein